ncbi:MAG: hypothetical protein RLZZ08_845 [Pseudomonadota bacterium]
MRSLDGQRVVVTGAAGGIGAPVARLLRGAGAHVIGVDRIACPEANETVVCDFADDRQLHGLMEMLAADPPDILVNIAGVMCFGPIGGQDLAQIALCQRINLFVPMALAKAVAGPMVARGSGHVVNIGSALGAIPYPLFSTYSASKAGLAAFSRALRRELDGSGVAVTHIAPRAVATPFNKGQVDRFLAIVKMKADQPEAVARQIVAAIIARRPRLTIGAMERVYAAIDAVLPGLIDSGLKPQIAKARAELF